MTATLAITTAGAVAAAVITDAGGISSVSDRQALGGTLPSVLDALRRANTTLDAIDLIAVCTGPGSFTGLRIGVAFAKSIAQGRETPLTGVSSYDVAAGDGEIVYPHVAIVEGKRGFYYARVLDRAGAAPRFACGSRETLRDVLTGARVYDLSEVPAAEQALRVGRLALKASPGDRPGWRAVQIDYGQRSNAEINWEAQRARRGGPPNA